MTVNKRKMYFLLSLLLVIAIIIPVVFSQPCFGRNPRGARLERVKKSPFYQDGQFQNEEPTELMTGKHNYLVTTMTRLVAGVIDALNTNKMKKYKYRPQSFGNLGEIAYLCGG